MSRLGWYPRTVCRAVAVVLGVVAAIAAITLVAIGIAALVRGHHHTPTTPVVTVTTDR